MQETAPPSSIFNEGRIPRRKDYQLPEQYEHELDRFALAHARKSEHTRRIYRSGATLFLAFLSQRWGAPPVEAISREHAETFQDFLTNESGYAPATIASTLVAARLFCKRLVEGDVLDVDPFGALPKLAPPVAPDVRILTAAEVQSMIDAAKRERSVWGARDTALICTLYSAGVRQQELLCIAPSDIDWGRCTVTIRRGKGGAPRTVGLDHNAMKALEQPSRPTAEDDLRDFFRWYVLHYLGDMTFAEIAGLVSGESGTRVHRSQIQHGVEAIRGSRTHLSRLPALRMASRRLRRYMEAFQRHGVTLPA